MRLETVYGDAWAVRVAFDLLKERTPEQSISHKVMPTFSEHEKFVNSVPYPYWYIVIADGAPVGSVYLTDKREVGIFIFQKHHGRGYATSAIKELSKITPGRMLANVNPLNDPSKKLFESLGGKVIQHTYEFIP